MARKTGKKDKSENKAPAGDKPAAEDVVTDEDEVTAYCDDGATDESEQPPENKPAEIDQRLMRETEKGIELYARIVQMAKNKRYVIVCPYLDGFAPGRMVVPKRGRTRKVFVQGENGLEEKIIPGKFSKRGAKFWVRPVGEVEGLYEFVKRI